MIENRMNTHVLQLQSVNQKCCELFILIFKIYQEEIFSFELFLAMLILK